MYKNVCSLKKSTTPVFGGVRTHVANLYNFLGFFGFVCLHPVFSVPNVVSVSGLSILDCHFRFSLTFI